MEKYIEAIIEIVLDHVTCLHQEIEEYPRGPKQADVTYGIDNEQEVIKKCLLIKPKPKVAEDWIAGEAYWPETPESREKWIEGKAKELITIVANLYVYKTNPCVIPKNKAKDFIRSLFIR